MKEKMKLNEYQKEALKTAHFDKEDFIYSIMYCGLGLNGEAGEVAEKIKKIARGDIENNQKDIPYELGDVLWYLSSLAHLFGYDLETIAKMNIKKLESRQKRNKIKGSGDNR